MGLEALCSSKFFSSNAGTAPTLPIPVLIDLDIRDAGFSRRAERPFRVTSSKEAKLRYGLKRRKNRTASPASSSFLGSSVPTSGLNPEESSSRRVQPCTCRANSSEREDGDHVPNGSSMVSLNFGSSNPEFGDEFFSRLSMALEASRLADSRASSLYTSAFFDTGSCDPLRPSLGLGVESPRSTGAASTSGTQGREEATMCGLGMGGVQLPTSIKKLRRPARLSRPVRDSSECPIKRAFSSMVYMIKAVQSHALQLRQALFSERDAQEVLHLMHREMHSSFVWLFQQVFACTPELMVSVMILLANFTVFSTGENIQAIAADTETPTPIAYFLSTYGTNPQASPPGLNMLVGTQMYSLPGLSKNSVSSPLASGSGSGGNNFPAAPIAENFGGDESWLNGTVLGERYMLSQKDSSMTPGFLSFGQLQGLGGSAGDHARDQRPASHQEIMKAWVESSLKELNLKSERVQLGEETIRRLVAPVVAHELESDNYACFDRTDLEYQHALAEEPRSSLLLANYAHFLYVVRHDNNRAEEYFHRAMVADPLDSTILGRFANFLWLGRRNRSAADRAFKAAMAADPDSSFTASSYAHFLWQLGSGDVPRSNQAL